MSLTQAETHELTSSLRRMGLAAEDESPALTPLTGGVSSLIVRADTAQGPVCVKRALPQLRVEAEWKVPVDRNSAEIGWMRFADAHAPGSVPAILGEDPVDQAFAMSWLNPDDHPVWKSRLLDGEVDVATARAVGAIVSRIHNASAGDTKLAGAFANDDNFHALRLDPYFGSTAPEKHPDCADALRNLIDRTANTKHALVHGDVSPKNILAGPKGPVILDAECAWYGDPAFDLSFCMTHLFLKCVWRPDLTDAYLECFDAYRDETVGHASWESPVDLEARVCPLLAATVLARIDGKSPVEYITDETDKDRVRHLARHFLLNPAHRLETMRDAWRTEWSI